MEFKKVKIDFITKETNPRYNIYLLLNNKYIQYVKDDHDCFHDLKKIKNRGVEDVYLDIPSYQKYIANLKKEQEEAFFDDNMIGEYLHKKEKLENLLDSLGFTKENLSLLKELNEESLKIINSARNLKDFIKMHGELSHSIIKQQLISTICLSIVDKLSNSEQVKKNISLALILCDLGLNESDFWDSFNYKKKDLLSGKILNHPKDIINKLPRDEQFQNSYILSFVKQHHEQPDGSGYPNRIDCSSIGLYPATYIISEYFVSLFLKKDLKLNEVKHIVREVNKKFGMFPNTEFSRVLKVFNEFYKDFLNE